MKRILSFLQKFFLIIVFCSFSHPMHVGKYALPKETKKMPPLQEVESTPQKYDLTICMMFHNEAAWLIEWIEYHRLVGVQHFYLYNNRSTDGFEAVLHDYIVKDIVTLVDWPYGTDKNYISKAQVPAYQHVLKEFGNQTKWMAIIDSDEFIVPLYKDSILDVLKEYEDDGGLVVNWQTFGTSGVAKVESNELMIEKLTWMALSTHKMNSYFKTILRTDRTDAEKCTMRHCNVHGFPYKTGYYAVNNKGRRVTLIDSEIAIETIQINHYRTRDEDYFMNNKVPRLEDWCKRSNDVINTLKSSMHEVENTAILRFVPALKERMWGTHLEG